MLRVRFLRKRVQPGIPGPERGSAAILVGFTVQGHAGFAEHGQDIVCAGVSALTQGALLGLQDVLGDRVSFRKQPGYLEVYVGLEDAREIAPRTILRTLELGLLSIAKAYPGHIDVAYQDIH